MAVAKQFTEKTVVTDKLTAGNFAPAKGAATKELIMTDHLLDGVVLEHSDNSEVITSDVAAVDQPLLMAKAEIEFSAGEPASGVVVSDADVTYTDHIASDVAEVVSDQPELVAMNVVDQISESTVQAGSEAAAGGIPWMWMGATAVAGGGLGLALGANQGNNDQPPAGEPAHQTEYAVHVVVERDGAFIDNNENGVWDDGIDEEAIFAGELDNVHLANNSVLIHFNDVPLEALDLTGFRADDKLQFDVQAMRDGHVFDYPSSLVTWVGSGSSDFTYGFEYGVDFAVCRHRHDTTKDFTSNSYYDQYALHVADIDTSINDTTSAIIAYWSDADNALNDIELLLPDNPVIANLNAGTGGGLVEFVTQSQHVVVDAAGAFIDVNANGIHDASETTVANFGSGGNADLEYRDVTVHFNAAPSAVLDLTGFGSDDQIEIDIDACYLGNARVPLVSQSPVNSHGGTLDGMDLLVAYTASLAGHGADSVHAFVGASYVASGVSNFLIGMISDHSDIIYSSKVVAHFGGYNVVTTYSVDFVMNQST